MEGSNSYVLLEPKQDCRVKLRMDPSQVQPLKRNLIRVVANKARQEYQSCRDRPTRVQEPPRSEWKDHQEYYEGPESQKCYLLSEVVQKEQPMAGHRPTILSTQSQKTIFDEAPELSTYKQVGLNELSGYRRLSSFSPELRTQNKLPDSSTMQVHESASQGFSLKPIRSNPFYFDKLIEVPLAVSAHHSHSRELALESPRNARPEAIGAFKRSAAPEQNTEVIPRQLFAANDSASASDALAGKTVETSQLHSTLTQNKSKT